MGTKSETNLDSQIPAANLHAPDLLLNSNFTTHRLSRPQLRADGFTLMAVLNVGGTSVDVVHVAAQLNSQFDLPWIPESVEQVWLEWIVGKVMQVIPAEILAIIADASDGLDAAEADQAAKKITTLANKLIDIPLLSESMEASLIEPVVRQLLGYAVTGKALTLTAGA